MSTRLFFWAARIKSYLATVVPQVNAEHVHELNKTKNI